ESSDVEVDRFGTAAHDQMRNDCRMAAGNGLDTAHEAPGGLRNSICSRMGHAGTGDNEMTGRSYVRPRSPLNRSVRVDAPLLQFFERNELEGGHVRRSEHDRCGVAGLVGLLPALHTHAPAIAGGQPLEAP